MLFKFKFIKELNTLSSLPTIKLFCINNILKDLKVLIELEIVPI
jgi:hypothetical protein